MNKLKLMYGIALLSLLSCSNSSKGVEIKGKLSNASKEKVAIDILGVSGVKASDSTTTNEIGEFSIKIDVKEIGFYRLRTSNPNSYMVLCLNNQEKVTVKADAKSLQTTSVVTGSPETEKMISVNRFLQQNLMKSDSLNKVYQLYANTPQQDSIVPILQAEYQNIQTNENKFLKKFFVDNSTSLVTLTLIDRLDKDKDFKIYKALDESLFKALPTNGYVQDFHKRIADMGKLMEGSLAPDFTLNTPEGKSISLSSFKGKVMLVDFWASWCGPCRHENPNVVKIYNKYHDKGFDILSVSLDKSKEKWVEAIAKDGLTWNHASDLGYWQSSVVPLYGISGIPLTILLDRNGVIVAKGLRGNELDAKVAEILNSK